MRATAVGGRKPIKLANRHEAVARHPGDLLRLFEEIHDNLQVKVARSGNRLSGNADRFFDIE
jgi:hypothetical protein